MNVSGSRYGRRIQVANTAAAVNARAKTLPFTGERGTESTSLQHTTAAVARHVRINTETLLRAAASSNDGESTAIDPGAPERSLRVSSAASPYRARHRLLWGRADRISARNAAPAPTRVRSLESRLPHCAPQA